MSLTADQQRAVAARGNVLVMAGAGTGKTSTLVARCIDCLSGSNPASLDQLLVVTFTEAAAAEARERIRIALEAKFAESGEVRWAEQLALFDTAHIGTLHSFCFKLVREHFYQLGLDPQVAVLDEGRARLLAGETLNELLEDHYAGKAPESAAIQELIETYGVGRDETIRKLVLRLHAYCQTRTDTRAWFAKQIAMFSTTDPTQWRAWLLEGISEWRNLWLSELRAMEAINPKAKECADLLEGCAASPDRARAGALMKEILAAKERDWPKGRKVELRKQLEPFFAGAEFLNELAPDGEIDPLTEDWNWSRGPMLALLRLTEQFTARFTERKQSESAVDFHDLEQLALQLLWGIEGRPAPVAESWRNKIRFVFVDEYQDINAAQDRIIAALSRDGADTNRFLVGDVKQSIYRFRLADPGIFRSYARDWKGNAGVTIPLRENFRSRAAILEFANAIFAPLMHEEVGGVNYDADAKLIFGLKPDAAATATREPAVEFCFRLTARSAADADGDDALEDLQEAEKEALHVALRLREVKASGNLVFDRDTKEIRPVDWRDMVVLLRAPANKAEGYAKQFERAGVPLNVARGGFYETSEVADILNLLILLDNPLQDVPLLAVLRSPLVALSLDELATIRLATKGHFWTALVRSQAHAQGANSRVSKFLGRFSRWRTLSRHGSLSKCIEAVLAQTHYAEWLRAQERGEQRHANVQRLLGLAEEFDQFQRQGLFRFLRFVNAQREAEAEPDVAAVATENSVRLMSVHQSKGLEFPVVVVADLGKSFNLQDLRAEIILDERFGLCPQVRTPGKSARYPSVAQWVARQRQQRELFGEELRLLYVAMTRAREKLILTGTMSRAQWDALPKKWPRLTARAIASARSAAEWLRLWLAHHGDAADGWFLFRELDDSELAVEPTARSQTENGQNAPDLDDKAFERLCNALKWEYPFRLSTQRTAKTSVTALRRQADEELEVEAERLFIPRWQGTPRRTVDLDLSAADVGKAHHKFLEHIALAESASLAGLKSEAERLVGEGSLTAEEFAALNFAALESFWRSEIGKRICANAAHVQRELPFTARFTPGELDLIVKGTVQPDASDGFVIVQGVADLVVLLPKEIWLLDFKTDDVTPSEVAAKEKFYAPQLQLYTLALERIYGRRVSNSWLHFLSCDKTLTVLSPAQIPAD